jgi:Holliday junction DNA helicase RuvA
MVPGIGKKGAQRIVLELKDRLGAPSDLDGAGASRRPARQQTWRDQVTSGLVNLGWSAKDADLAVVAVESDFEEAGQAQPDVPAALRAALRKLSKS